MVKPNKAYFLFSFVLSLLFVEIAYLTEQVVIEFLYWNPSDDPRWCPTCDQWLYAYEAFLRKSEIIDDYKEIMEAKF